MRKIKDSPERGNTERNTEISESALNDQFEQTRAILETAVEAIISISSSGIIEVFNRAAERLFGYDRKEVFGRNVSMLMPSPYRDEHDSYLANYLKSGHAKIIGIGREVTGLRKDGSTFPMKLAVSEVNLADRVIFTGFIEDLTERKRLEKEAEDWRNELEIRVEHRTAALERVKEELEHFAYTISHDLRTPLRGIRNYVDFLTEDLQGNLSGESALDLSRLGKAAGELEKMIQDLLNYSRIGRVESSPHEVSAQKVIKEIIQEMKLQKDQEVLIKGEFPSLYAPTGVLRQVFQNLIENGLRYNRSNPRRVEITGGRIPDRPGWWLLSFKDNGIGIDTQYHAKIFGMFKRLHSDEDFPGTGIGLAAVRKALQHLGGSVRVESALGRGSTFFVELPERVPSSIS